MADQLALDVPVTPTIPGARMIPAPGALFALPAPTTGRGATPHHAPAGDMLALLDARVIQPDPAWLDRATCTTPEPGGLDHTTLTEETAAEAKEHGGWYVQEHKGHRRLRRYAADVRAAKAVCLACPVRLQCRTSAVHVAEVSGVAGAWTETERDRYRARHLIPRPGEALEPYQVTPEVLVAVADLTDRGWTADRIAAHLDSPEIDAGTVAYARQVIAGSKPGRGVA